MGIFSKIFGDVDMDTNEGIENKEFENKELENNNADDQKLLLHREELDISKNRVQVGSVELSKEIIEEQKIVDVPVALEEVVIERRPINNEFSDSPITNEQQSIHIPISEEQVQVGKHTVVTEEIEAYKRETQNTRHIEETLKREEALINKEGNARIVDEKSEKDFL